MPMVLSVNPVTQAVGYATIFSITGGPPNAEIAWSSTLNGVPTGEDHAMYAGQVTDANGNWSASGGNWPASMAGEWEKIAYVYPPDGTPPWTAHVSFRVVAGQGAPPQTLPTGTPPPTNTGQPGGSPLSGTFNIGGYQVPKVAAYITIGAAVLFLMPSGGGGRR